MAGITVAGPYGALNLGDEAILRALVHLFADSGDYRVENVILFGRGRQSVLDEHMRQGIAFTDFAKFFRSIPLVMRSHLVIGGGGMFQGRGLLWPFSYMSLLILANRLSGRRPVLLGIGADRITHPVSRFLFRRFFGMAAVITCRDDYTASLVRNYGLPAERIVVTADFAFALPEPTGTRTGDKFRALVVPGCDRKFLRPATDLMRDIITRLAQRPGVPVEVIVMPHDLRESYDLVEVRRVCEGLTGGAVSLFVPDTLSEALAVYRSVDLVVSNRLHPLILGAVHGAVPVAAGYPTRKNESIIAMLQIPNLGDPSGDRASLSRLDELTDSRLAAIRAALAEPVARLRAAARRNRDLALAAWGPEKRPADR